MDYFIGSLVTILTMIFVAKRVVIQSSKLPVVNLRQSQSKTHELIKGILPFNWELAPVAAPTQASIHNESMFVRVIIAEEKAYWIKDNSVYSADIEDGYIDNDSARVVDMMAIDDVQLDKMIFIVDKLTEGRQNDLGNTGNKRI
jgi:hypothetical protein